MPAVATDVRLTDAQRTMLWRYEQGRAYGLTRLEARLFAEDTTIDVSELRRLVRVGCPPRVGAMILLGSP